MDGMLVLVADQSEPFLSQRVSPERLAQLILSH